MPQITIPPNYLEDVLKLIQIKCPELIVMPGRVPSRETLFVIKESIENDNYKLMAAIKKIEDGQYSLEHMAQLLQEIVINVHSILYASILLNFPFNQAWEEYIDVSLENQAILNNDAGNTHFLKDPNIWSILYKRWTAFILQQDSHIIVEKGAEYNIKDYIENGGKS